MTDSGSGRGGIDTDERGRAGRAMTTVRSLAIVALVVTAASLAGCGMLGGGDGGDGGDGDGGAQGNIDAPREIAEPMDPSASEVFSRVTEIMDVEGEAPGVRVTNLPTSRNLSSPFMNAMVGLPDDPQRLTNPVNATYDPEEETVLFNDDTVFDLNGSQIEYQLAYNFALGLHYQNDWIDAESTESAVLRGTLEAVMREYADEHMDVNFVNAYDSADAAFEATTPYEWATYDALNYYGADYVDSQTDSASEISSIYEGGVPETTEQLLHDTDEGPTDLSVTADVSNWWIDERMPRLESTLGELGTRAVLRSQLSASEATAAADGWGNDTGMAFTSARNESAGAVWVHSWDSASEADEFVNASQAYGEARADGTYAVNVTRPAEDTTVVVAHRGTFMQNTEIAYADGTVEVVVGGGSS
ncbi:hypothetical protein C475_03104 [Halosimplex carlsbadense 2-9-1]|uniref:Uncharacterized protein n=1 Tax=Halosimplex carlsbadense 2-9-1 TaxID=797114 RepID=M0D0Y6_9EURY|nr:hypothetical protein [Halosimplex carlsbadense]ELZ29171.1 hypothetical protein C475_03104 [Halosimplex carlsbadense 2-9-1]